MALAVPGIHGSGCGVSPPPLSARSDVGWAANAAPIANTAAAAIAILLCIFLAPLSAVQRRDRWQDQNCRVRRHDRRKIEFHQGEISHCTGSGQSD
jgi:hypothetical protein